MRYIPLRIPSGLTLSGASGGRSPRRSGARGASGGAYPRRSGLRPGHRGQSKDYRYHDS